MTAVKERKPRTNDEAINRFVANLLSNDVGPYVTVNSMLLEGDTIYHYGHHYPMAMIVRKGRWNKPVAILINSTRWGGQSGFGWSTDGTVSSIKARAKRLVEEHGLDVAVHDFPLTNPGRIFYEPDPSDPKPEIPNLRDIPVCPRKDVPTNPGDEPVKDRDGWTIYVGLPNEQHVNMPCIAGTTVEYEWADYSVLYDWSKPSPGEFVTSRDYYGDGEQRRVRHTAGVERIYYSEKRGYHTDPAKPEGFRQVMCPHCARFEDIHMQWYRYKHGGYGIRMGWDRYVEMIDRYGSPDGWREARSKLVKLIKQRKDEYAEWYSRNTISYDLIPSTRNGLGRVRIPDINLDGTIPKAKAERLKRKHAVKLRRQEIEARRRAKEAQQQREEAARKRKEFKAAIEAGTLTEPVDPTIIDWLVQHNVPVENGLATLYKRVQPAPDGGLRSDYTPSFRYVVGEWAVADDYEPRAHCGHGLHFAESADRTPSYGSVIIECKVPVVTLINMTYKVKAERCLVVRIVEDN